MTRRWVLGIALLAVLALATWWIVSRSTELAPRPVRMPSRVLLQAAPRADASSEASDDTSSGHVAETAAGTGGLPEVSSAVEPPAKRPSQSKPSSSPSNEVSSALREYERAEYENNLRGHMSEEYPRETERASRSSEGVDGWSTHESGIRPASPTAMPSAPADIPSNPAGPGGTPGVH